MRDRVSRVRGGALPCRASGSLLPSAARASTAGAVGGLGLLLSAGVFACGSSPSQPGPAGPDVGSGGSQTGPQLPDGNGGNAGTFIIGDPDPGCTGDTCSPPPSSCPGGGQTTISGTVYAPSGTLPLYNVMVYVPSAPLSPLSSGATCACEVSGDRWRPRSPTRRAASR